MSENRSYAALISAILAAGKQRERFPRPRTYTPGPRQLASMTSPVLIAEVQRRIVYQQGRLSDRDCRHFHDEFSRRGFAVAAGLFAGAAVVATGSALADRLATLPALASFRAARDEAFEAYDQAAREADAAAVVPLTAEDMLLDMQELGMPETAIDAFDRMANTITFDLSEALEAQAAQGQDDLGVELFQDFGLDGALEQ